MNELKAMTDRLCRLMDWPQSTSHKFEIVRRTCRGEAAALSIEKGNQLADKLESLMRENCDLRLALAASDFLEGMAE